jgi:hypothetical protein
VLCNKLSENIGLQKAVGRAYGLESL